ncbi:hypothetical protein ADK57_05730 [Streptomyces sp. MMG1533]|uniref:hypothetical protein n=1 Tax=Streptomyces sp. MMG1533 TaxID=1415546 RepID=UPI0006AE328D|nr:hypothetical protein [Streptomyces sp. MMG1533]KOU76038.1 hypothetical protein ADK57_05730 [Streptomyces sp. MMG1533]
MRLGQKGSVLQSFTWSAFDRGPADRVLDIVLKCQESAGERELEGELARFIRLIRWSNEAQWLCPVTTVSALLDLAAELWGAGLDRLIAPTFREKVDRASGGSDQVGYLNMLAGTVRAVEGRATTDIGELPFSEWESEVEFRRLQGFSGNWLDDAEYETLDECVTAAIDSEHPYCAEYLGPISAEAQTALVRKLQSPEAGASLGRIMPWATADALGRLLDIINDHMRHAHSPDCP